MDSLDKLKGAGGGYIFLSHSHADILKVREIRNELESKGFEPLCFYLKCLEDEEEIEDLIKREIDAREWFVFVNSENSRNSRWVTLEREYITATNKKKIITVDLDDERSVISAMDKITENLRLFLTYSSRDERTARRIKERFEEKDYLVFFAPDSCAGTLEDYEEKANEAILNSACQIVLLSQSAARSPWVRQEVELAYASKRRIIVIMLGEKVDMDPGLRLILDTMQHYRLPEDPSDEQINGMIDRIGDNICRM